MFKNMYYVLKSNIHMYNDKLVLIFISLGRMNLLLGSRDRLGKFYLC